MTEPCGQIIGHGERCSSGWLCSDCKEKSQIAEQERDRFEALEARLAEADALIEKARSAMVFDQSWNVDAYILIPQFDAYLGQSK